MKTSMMYLIAILLYCPPIANEIIVKNRIGISHCESEMLYVLYWYQPSMCCKWVLYILLSTSDITIFGASGTYSIFKYSETSQLRPHIGMNCQKVALILDSGGTSKGEVPRHCHGRTETITITPGPYFDM